MPFSMRRRKMLFQHHFKYFGVSLGPNLGTPVLCVYIYIYGLGRYCPRNLLFLIKVPIHVTEGPGEQPAFCKIMCMTFSKLPFIWGLYQMDTQEGMDPLGEKSELESFPWKYFTFTRYLKKNKMFKVCVSAMWSWKTIDISCYVYLTRIIKYLPCVESTVFGMGG